MSDISPAALGMIAIGVGCSRDCDGETITRLVRRALAATGLKSIGLTGVGLELVGLDGAAGLFTTVDKQAESGLREAAASLGLPLVYLPRAALEAVAHKAETRSERVVQLFGVPSIAETAALAGAGPGGRLLVKRISEGGATCAIAVSAAKDLHDDGAGI